MSPLRPRQDPGCKAFGPLRLGLTVERAATVVEEKVRKMGRA
jgi:hypothetical protein